MPLGSRLRVRAPPSHSGVRRANHTASLWGRGDDGSEGLNPQRSAPPGPVRPSPPTHPPPFFGLHLPGGGHCLRPGLREPRPVRFSSAALLTAAAGTRPKPSGQSRRRRLSGRGVSPPSLAARALRARDRKWRGGASGARDHRCGRHDTFRWLLPFPPTGPRLFCFPSPVASGEEFRGFSLARHSA